ncbi:MAG: hypothetical protein AAF411_12120 [Myxococcota bacterium]
MSFPSFGALVLASALSACASSSIVDDCRPRTESYLFCDPGSTRQVLRCPAAELGVVEAVQELEAACTADPDCIFVNTRGIALPVPTRELRCEAGQSCAGTFEEGNVRCESSSGAVDGGQLDAGTDV